MGLINQDFVLKRDLSKVHYKNKNNKIILEIVIVSLKNFLKIFKKIINHNDIKIKKLKEMNKAKKQGKDVDSYLKINHQMMTSLCSIQTLFRGTGNQIANGVTVQRIKLVPYTLYTAKGATERKGNNHRHH